ncbi:hypothetical protein [Shinella zoogloeoides]|uniref:hypothetical protein n=1 Tax=Shinella zoogloeoides TaxID=352475 RepID=UPI0028AC98EB|nr:hypothetical protein [Shinella zoogloeoides]
MMGRLRSLLSCFRRRPAPREIILPPFHPIIFANGRDDDGPGIKAFYEGRPIICQGREIGPGDTVLRDLKLSLSCVAIQFRRGGAVVETVGFPLHARPSARGGILTIDVQPGSRRMMSHCTFLFGLRVEP